MATVIESSNDVARQARESLNTLGGLQTELVDGLIDQTLQASHVLFSGAP